MIANGTFDLNPKQIGLMRYSQERADSNYGSSAAMQRSANLVSRKSNAIMFSGVGMQKNMSSFKPRMMHHSLRGKNTFIEQKQQNAAKFIELS